MNLGEVPGVMPKGLSVRCDTVSVRAARTGNRPSVHADRRTRSASVISMLDSWHLSKVVEADLARL